jgi:serine/threonine protein kinase
MTAARFHDVALLLSEASSPEDVFPSLRAGPRPGGLGWRAALRGEYDRLRAAVDPAAFPGDAGARAAAETLSHRLDELYREALGETATESAGYREAPPAEPAASSRLEIRAARGAYAATRVLARGDLATVYAGRSLDGAGDPVIVKVAIDRADNDLLHDEAAALELLHSAGGPQRKHLPRLLDRFQTSEGLAGNVLSLADGFDLLAVRDRYPDGVPAEHVIWMLRRLLSALGYAHREGVIHGNIEPSHVMIRPSDHNLVLLDWCYSIIAPGRTGRGFKCENPDYSPPEVGQRRPPIPASDLYSVGRCAIFLLGGDLATGKLPAAVDDRLARFVAYLTRTSPLQRAQDAWDMFEELGRLRRAIFGAHRFVPFEM